MTDRFPVDGEELESHILHLGTIGEDPDHGLFRPVYSESWVRARDTMQGWMEDAGLVTRVDAVGNLYGRLPGDVDGPVVLSGSHLDTVRDGGKYDGALGIHAALAAVAAIKRSGSVPQRPIEVVALCEEEGSRFPSPMWGTQAILGLIRDGVADELVDNDGTTMAQAMRAVGLDAARIPEARRTDIAAFVEFHIEQGGILETEGLDAGIVEAIVGQRHLNVEVVGTQNHAGTTPMDLRSDALAGAAEMAVAVEEVARSWGRPAVATIGQFGVEPGSRNVIPGRATFTVDARHSDADALLRLTDAIREKCDQVAAGRGLEVRVDEVFYRAPTPMDTGIVALLGETAQRRGLTTQLMPSGAGHDSQIFGEHLPTGMIFTPSVGGISHSPEEFTRIESIVPCVGVLADALWELANR